MNWIDQLSFDDRGLVAGVVQDAETGEVLMLAWMNREAVEQTAQSGWAHFWSRSRRSLWRKGETSGNGLRVEEIRVDCDADALLLLVSPQGPACHTGANSCFYRRAMEDGALAPIAESALSGLQVLTELQQVIRSRRTAHQDDSYTSRLLSGGIERIAKKVGEEAFETALAAAAQSDDRLAEEAADLLYHLLVLLEARNLSLQDACDVLSVRRSGRS